MKNNFVAIDFETSYGHIPCSIGIVEFIDGEVAEEYYSLIKPIDLKFNPINSRINGIHLEDVFNEKEFDELWGEIEHFFIDRVVISHNSSFDISVLEKTLDFYKIHKPNYDSFCTLSISQSILDIENHKLSSLAKYFNIKQVDYHNALEDAYVCGKVFYELFDKYNELKDKSKLQSFTSSNIKNNYGQYLSRINNQRVISNPFIWKKSNKLEGKTFVVSGVFEQFSRDDLKKAIEENGGKVGSSISAKTDYVVAGANMGPAKLEKANKLNIAIISETDFMKLINESE